MVQQCFIKDCPSKWSVHSKSNKVAFFQFPTESKYKNAWMNAILHLNDQTNIDQINLHSRICEKHFEYDNVVRHKCRTTLVKGSVPTIFPRDQCSEAEFLLLSDDEMIDLNTFCTEKPSDSENLILAETSYPSTYNELKENIAVKDIKSAGHVLYVCEHCGHSNPIEVSKLVESSTLNSDADVELSEICIISENFKHRNCIHNSFVQKIQD